MLSTYIVGISGQEYIIYNGLLLGDRLNRRSETAFNNIHRIYTPMSRQIDLTITDFYYKIEDHDNDQ